jgi:hypothetical protein
MRTILVDWLVEVGEEYDLDTRTFIKAVSESHDIFSVHKVPVADFNLFDVLLVDESSGSMFDEI